MAASLSCLTVTFVTKNVSSFVIQQRVPSSRRVLSLSTASSRLFSTTTEAAETETTKPGLVPVTLLSGFLGSGKTTTLQHLLENTDGLRIGVIVNDMASVNIDAKLVKNSDSMTSKSSSSTPTSTSSSNGVVELQNGCACCSLADELLSTVENLVDSRTTTEPFDAIVVELSGVADPIAIQSNWVNAQLNKHSVTTKADMKRIVTLIDSSTFGTDWMTWDSVGEREGWIENTSGTVGEEEADSCASQRKVPELLAEQIEAADILLLNKIDIAGPEQVKIASVLARQINENAIIEEVEFGKVTSPKQIIRDDIISIIKNENENDETTTTKSSCNDSDCTDSSHSHSHAHSHGHNDDDESSSSSSTAAATCTEPDCADPDCSDHNPVATTTADDDCADPGCTDETHDHSHASHSHSKSTSTDNLGIINFVYKADRPFETRNLMSLLNTWPVPIKENLNDLLQYEQDGIGEDAADKGNDTRESPFSGVLRSKGFCWLAPTKWSNNGNQPGGNGGDQWRHDTAMYWSHAGRHFGISTAGKWWATLPNEQMKEYFEDDTNEYDRIMEEDFQKDSKWGDRRQEIVFIGININEAEITKALDNCLIGPVGMEKYSQQLSNYMNTILSAPVSDGATGGLFDVGNTDHVDQ